VYHEYFTFYTMYNTIQYNLFQQYKATGPNYISKCSYVRLRNIQYEQVINK